MCPFLSLRPAQDAVKKITGDELPDFYNIVLERPKDDPDGYDVLFIDAAAKVGGGERAGAGAGPAMRGGQGHAFGRQRAQGLSIDVPPLPCIPERLLNWSRAQTVLACMPSALQVCRRLSSWCYMFTFYHTDSLCQLPCDLLVFCPLRAGRAGQPHEPQLHTQLPGHRDGVQRAPHHCALHTAPGGLTGGREA